MTRTIAVLLALAAASGAAVAQGTIYRCGNAYSHLPCRDGRAIDTADSARTAAQRDEALRVAASERKLADDMERDRHRAEAVRPAPAVYIGPSKPPTSSPKASSGTKTKKKKKDDAGSDDFVAVAPKKKN